MAQIDQAMLQLGEKILKQLERMNTASGTSGVSKDRSAYKEKKTTDSVAKSLERIEKSSENLHKGVSKAVKDLEQSRKVLGTNLTTFIKNSLLPAGRQVKEVVRDFDESMEGIVKNQTDEYKKLARNTRDYIKANSNATEGIRNAIAANRDYMNVVKNIAKEQRKMTDDEVTKLKKFTDIIEDLKNESGGMIDARRYKNKMTADQYAIYEKLRKGTKLTNDEFKALLPILDQVGKNFKVIGDASGGVANAYKQAAHAMPEMQKAMLNGLRNVFVGLRSAAVAAAPQLYKDLMAQTQNGVATSSYDQAFRLGVSQAELSEFVGKNRMSLRSIGDGRSTTPIDNGQINDLQNQVGHMFGVTGNEALKFLGTSFDNLISMGLTPTVENTKATMDTLRDTMLQTGMTFDQLNSMVSDLSHSPAFLQLVQAQGYSDQANQLKLLSKMVVSQGYSAEYLKQLLELNKNQMYEGVAEGVRGMVGVQLLGSKLGMSKDDTNLQSLLRAKGPGALTEMYNRGDFKNTMFNNKKLDDVLKEQFGEASGQAFSNFALSRQNDWNKASQAQGAKNAASGSIIGGMVNNTLLNAFADMAGPAYQQRDSALIANATLKGRTGSLDPTKDQVDKMLGGNDVLAKSINDVSNSFLDLIPIQKEYFAALKEGIDGFRNNPLGQSGGGLTSAVGGAWDAFTNYMGIKTLLSATGVGGGVGIGSKIMGGLGGIGSKLMGGLGGIGGAIGNSKYMTLGRLGLSSVGGLGAGAVGSGAGMVAGAGAAGYGVGSLLNMVPRLFGSEDLSTQIVDFLMRDKDAAVAAMLHGNPVVNGNDMKTMISKSDVTQAQVTSDGSTLGELSEEQVSELKQLNVSIKKLLDFMEASHKEAMEKAFQDKVLKGIGDSRLRTRDALVSG